MSGLFINTIAMIYHGNCIYLENLKVRLNNKIPSKRIIYFTISELI